MDARNRDRREDERFELKNAYGELIFNGRVMPCRFIDISMGGCCVQTERVFSAGALQDVEVVLLLYGLVMRIRGKTQWATRDCQVGVRFVHPTSRSKNQLASLLTCLLDETAADAIKEAVASSDTFQLAGPVVAPEFVAPHIPAPKPVQKCDKQDKPPKHTPAPSEPEDADQDEEVPEAKAGVEGRATLRFLRDGAHIFCDIVDLRMGGCCILTSDRFGTDLHARVEVCFQMCGLPFQLLGEIKAIKDTASIEVEFLEMSRRKQEELAEVIEELRERAHANKQN
jgi:hypothetical protein